MWQYILYFSSTLEVGLSRGLTAVTPIHHLSARVTAGRVVSVSDYHKGMGIFLDLLRFPALQKGLMDIGFVHFLSGRKCELREHVRNKCSRFRFIAERTLS